MKTFVAFIITLITVWGLSHVDAHTVGSFNRERIASELGADSNGIQQPSSPVDDVDTCSNCHIGHCPFPVTAFDISFKEIFNKESYLDTSTFSLSNFVVSILRPPIA